MALIAVSAAATGAAAAAGGETAKYEFTLDEENAILCNNELALPKIK